MKRLHHWAARLYPSAWRRRYGNELDALIESSNPSLGDVVDLLVNAGRAHANPRFGGHVMHDRQTSHPMRYAALALAITFPTAILTCLSILKYVVGIAAPFDAVEPVATPIVVHPIGETVLILAPYAALLLAVVPVSRISIGRQDGRWVGQLRVATPLLNVLVAALSSALILVMAAYYLVENV